MRRSLLASLLAVAALGAGGARLTDAAPVAHGPLRWAPPPLQSPITIAVGDGYTQLHLDPVRDYVIRLPTVDKRGGLTLAGGHDVVVVGGHVTIPAGAPPGRLGDRQRRGLYIKDATGTVHVEGVLFDADHGVQWDAIDIAAPAAVVQIENVRVEQVRGAFRGFHGDVVQPWGGVRELRIDRLTATSDYQGLTIPIDKGPIGSARISDVNIRGLSSGPPGTDHLLWLTTGSATCSGYPVSLTSVYVQPRRGQSLGRTVWPERGAPRGCHARVGHRRAAWPLLPGVHGPVHLGSPPHGSFVPPGAAGAGYATPGYAQAARRR
jgi:hypothetical protein